MENFPPSLFWHSNCDTFGTASLANDPIFRSEQLIPQPTTNFHAQNSRFSQHKVVGAGNENQLNPDANPSSAPIKFDAQTLFLNIDQKQNGVESNESAIGVSVEAEIQLDQPPLPVNLLEVPLVSSMIASLMEAVVAQQPLNGEQLSIVGSSELVPPNVIDIEATTPRQNQLNGGQSPDFASESPAEGFDFASTELGETGTREVSSNQELTQKISIQIAKQLTPNVEASRAQSQQLAELGNTRLGLQNGELKKISFELHPAELGRLTIHVGLENDSVRAHIIATELATTELLNRDKGFLMDALHSNGMEFGSFDVSHQDSQDAKSFQDQNPDQIESTADAGTESENKADLIRQVTGDGQILDVVV